MQGAALTELACIMRWILYMQSCHACSHSQVVFDNKKKNTILLILYIARYPPHTLW